MIRGHKFVLVVTAALTLAGASAKADDPQQFKTKKGSAVMLGNFFSAAPDCSSTSMPVPLPTLRVKPVSGLIFMQIVTTDVAEGNGCPARKAPAIALYYKPNANFEGVDSVQVEFATEVNTTAQSFQITVQAN